MNEVRFRLRGLTKIDVAELEGSTGIVIEEETIPVGAHGEPTTFALLVTLAGISALSAYLLRKHEGQSFEEIGEIVHPDGRVERRIVRWSANSVEPPDSSLIKQIRGDIHEP
jgi:hypothetical protein